MKVSDNVYTLHTVFFMTRNKKNLIFSDESKLILSVMLIPLLKATTIFYILYCFIYYIYLIFLLTLRNFLLTYKYINMACLEIITLVISIFALIISALAFRYSKKQYLVGIKPELWSNGICIKKTVKRILFDISNRGCIATLKSIKIKTNNLRHISNPFPYDLETDGSIDLHFDYIGTNINDDNFKVEIKYTDKDNNTHTATLICTKSSNCRIE